MKTNVIAAGLLATLGTLVLAAGDAKAHSNWRYNRYNYETREARQNALIQQGWRNGSLTWRELRNLRREQARVDHLEHRFLADGRMTWRERLALAHAQDHAVRHIQHERHDSESRRWW